MSTRKPESEFQIVPGKFTTGYESTIAFGEMHLDLPEEERRYALRLLVNKYSSAFKEIGEKYIEKSFPSLPAKIREQAFRVLDWLDPKRN